MSLLTQRTQQFTKFKFTVYEECHMSDQTIQTIQAVGLLSLPFVVGGLIIAVCMIPYAGPILVLGGLVVTGLAKWWV